MTSTEQYIELLRAGLWNRPARVSSPVLLKDISELATRQSTLPLIYCAILAIPDITIPEKLATQMEAVVDKCAKSHKAANTVIAFVTSDLEAAGIPSVLLKGQGIASYYPNPELRQAGDIDLYVGSANYADSCKIMGARFPKEGNESDKHASFHVGGSLFLELHEFTEILHPERLNAIYQSISDEGTASGNIVIRKLDGADIPTPEDTFNAFYIFNHLWEHTRNMGIGIRQLCDWAVFLHTHNGQLDTHKLNGWLKDLHLLNVWQVFGCTAIELLEIDQKDVPFYDSRKTKRGHRLAKFILEQGDNREFKHGRGKSSSIKHKAGSLAFIFIRFSQMVLIFPKLAFNKTIGDIIRGSGKIFAIFVKSDRTE